MTTFIVFVGYQSILESENQRCPQEVSVQCIVKEFNRCPSQFISIPFYSILFFSFFDTFLFLLFFFLIFFFSTLQDGLPRLQRESWSDRECL